MCFNFLKEKTSFIRWRWIEFSPFSITKCSPFAHPPTQVLPSTDSRPLAVARAPDSEVGINPIASFLVNTEKAIENGDL